MQTRTANPARLERRRVDRRLSPWVIIGPLLVDHGRCVPITSRDLMPDLPPSDTSLTGLAAWTALDPVVHPSLLLNSSIMQHAETYVYANFSDYLGQDRDPTPRVRLLLWIR